MQIKRQFPPKENPAKPFIISKNILPTPFFGPTSPSIPFGIGPPFPL
jgi:hypothetical protein